MFPLLFEVTKPRRITRGHNYQPGSVGKRRTEMVKRALGEQGATLRSLGG